MLRIIVYNPQDEFVREISPNDVFSASISEKINDQHSLTITTTADLEKEQRVLIQDEMGKYREFVITGSDEGRNNSKRIFKEYKGVWSLQHDLKLVACADWYDAEELVNASTILRHVLSNTSRWNVGTVTNTTIAGAAIYQKSAYEGLVAILEAWGGEIDADITVDLNGVVSRKVSLYTQMGKQTATRRFDYARDLTSIRRKVDEMPIACRIRPLGKSYKTIDELDIKITVEEVNDGKDYIQNDSMAQYLRLPNGKGGWEYPTVDVENTEIEDEEELLEWAYTVLDEYTTPIVTYEASVLQFHAAGTDVSGVTLGDYVQCVDKEFGESGVRLDERVIAQTIDLLNPDNTTITLGDVSTSYILNLGGTINKMNSRINNLSSDVISTAEYLNNLLDHLNEQINATGGYTYITSGQGVRTYDKAVSDPLVGAEATAVVEIKGGTIRIANSKTETGEWNWRSVFVAGHIAADMVTAVNVTAGYIGNASQGSYWDLDNNTLQIATGALIGNTTAGTLLSDVDTAKTNANQAITDASDAKKVATNYLTFSSSNGLDVGYSGTSAKTRIKGNGVEIYDSSGIVALFAGIESSKSIVRVGRASGSGQVLMSSDGYVDVRYGSVILAHFGYGEGTDSNGGTSIAPYYNVGIRKSGTVGNYSVAEGYNTTASGYTSHAEGQSTSATAADAHAEGRSTTASGGDSHAEGYNTTASGGRSHAEGNGCVASGTASHAGGGGCEAKTSYSFAHGYNCVAEGTFGYHIALGEGCKTTSQSQACAQVVVGSYNKVESAPLFIVGKGSSDSYRYNAFTVDYNGDGWFYGYSNAITHTDRSDRRLKEHIAYIDGGDAAKFVRSLRPVLFSWKHDKKRSIGFYAQDVRESDVWHTDIVGTSKSGDGQIDYEPLTLNYSALIAPLVAYTQQLEKRIDEQQKQIDELKSMLEELMSSR